MTLLEPSLKVSRLVVTKGGKSVYDERFHSGVNVIRGKNSSGKSTIADFLFYGLGGELTKWKKEAQSCDFVYIEAFLSGKVFTLKREVDVKSRRGMDIFAGNFEAASFIDAESWLRYPYNATEKKESFYQVLLKELGLPYSKSEDKNSITMHQLLRMMYVDQMTSPDRLFKFDQFDSSNKREAIGELLLGVSDFDLYESRVSLQKLEAKLENKAKEIRTVHEFLGGEVKTCEEIDKEIATKLEDIRKLEEKMVDCIDDKPSEMDEQLEQAGGELRLLRDNKFSLLSEISALNFEIMDSQRFVESLNSRLIALADTSKTINALSDISFVYCPACFSHIEKRESGCHLCGCEKNKEDREFDPTFKVRKEIEFQISESVYLLGKRQVKLQELETKLSQTLTEIGVAENEYSALLKPKSSVSINTRNILKEIGSLTKQIEELNNSKEKYSKLFNSYAERDAIQKKVNELKDIISRKTYAQEKELRSKKNALSIKTMRILRADQDHEEIFQKGELVDFDFAEDRVAIDDRVLFSASSMVYLKNAFRLSMLQTSCEDKSFLYPRFILMDNIEDKGMEPARSHLFQKEIIRISNSLTVDHQIIFTTSLIAPEIEGSEYCVGDYYTDQNKTLRFANLR